MSSLSANIIELLRYLVPGFLAAWVFYGLTPYSKPSEFERVVQALVLTLFVQVLLSAEHALLVLAGSEIIELGTWDAKVELANSLLIAGILGGTFALCANKDWIHGILRWCGVTRQTSYPSEWYGGLNAGWVTYVVLHMHDERRVYGFMRESPKAPTEGHFLILEPSWVHQKQEKRMTGVKSILINVQDVKWVEVLNQPSEQSNGKASI